MLASISFLAIALLSISATEVELSCPLFLRQKNHQSPTTTAIKNILPPTAPPAIGATFELLLLLLLLVVPVVDCAVLIVETTVTPEIVLVTSPATLAGSVCSNGLRTLTSNVTVSHSNEVYLFSQIHVPQLGVGE